MLFQQFDQDGARIEADEFDVTQSAIPEGLRSTFRTGFIGGEDAVDVGMRAEHVFGYGERLSDGGHAEALIHDLNLGKFFAQLVVESVLAGDRGSTSGHGIYHDNLSFAVQDGAEAVGSHFAAQIVICGHKGHVAIGGDTGVKDDYRDTSVSGAIHCNLEGRLIRWCNHDGIHMAVDHGFHDLHFTGDVGFTRWTFPDDVDITFPSAFYGTCMHALPEEVSGGLGYNRDLLFSAFLAGK